MCQGETCASPLSSLLVCLPEKLVPAEQVPGEGGGSRPREGKDWGGPAPGKAKMTPRRESPLCFADVDQCSKYNCLFKGEGASSSPAEHRRSPESIGWKAGGQEAGTPASQRFSSRTLLKLGLNDCRAGCRAGHQGLFSSDPDHHLPDAGRTPPPSRL